MQSFNYTVQPVIAPSRVSLYILYLVTVGNAWSLILVVEALVISSELRPTYFVQNRAVEAQEGSGGKEKLGKLG